MYWHCADCGEYVNEETCADHKRAFHEQPPASDHDKAMQVRAKITRYDNFAKPQPLGMSRSTLEMLQREFEYRKDYPPAPHDLFGSRSIADIMQRTMEARIRDDHFTLAMNYLFGPASAAKQEVKHWSEKLPIPSPPRKFPRYCVHYTGTPLQDLCWAYRKLAKKERSLRRTWGDWMAEQWWQLRMPDVAAEQHEPRLPHVADSRGVGWSPPWLDEDGE